jgi:uncharacterized repeat protein (TIGR03803 family)
MPSRRQLPLAHFIRTLTIVTALLALAAVGSPRAAASELRTLHDFCVVNECPDGQSGDATLVMDAAGNLYGTTEAGGAHLSGTVFALFWHPNKQTWKYEVLYNFCTLNNCADGFDPESVALVVDVSGNLYGTTAGGGAGNDDAGTVFKLAPNAKRTRWTLSTIYNFCTTHSDCSDGFYPRSGLAYQGATSGALYDGMSPLYGVALGGGKRSGGVVYTISPKTHGGWAQRVVYAFCAEGGSNCTDGFQPSSVPLVDAAGNLFGVTATGGAQASGVAYKLSPGSGQHMWSETLLHDFCSLSACADGSVPLGNLVEDASGNLYGVAAKGGNPSCNGGCGVIYKIAPDNNQSVIYAFCSLVSCADGRGPSAGLTMDNAGNILGTAPLGGANNAGVLYQLSGSTFSVIYSFCAQTNCADGAGPNAGVVLDAAGDVFGTTQAGGAANRGTVFELVP